MEDSMDDSLDNAEEDMAFQGNSKDDETSSSVDTLFKVEDSGEESGGEDQGDFQGFRGGGEGSSGEDGIYEDAVGDSNAASDREGFMDRISDDDGYDGSPVSGARQQATRGFRTSGAVSSGFVSLGEEEGSLLDAFDPNADPVFVDRSAKNASPAGKIFRELRSSTEDGRNFPTSDEGDKECNDRRFLGFSTDCSAIRGSSFHKLKTVNSFCDDGSEEDIVSGDSDPIETRLGACQKNASCCPLEEADGVNIMGMGDKDRSPEHVVLDAVAEGRVERAQGKKGARTARSQVDAFSAPDYKCGGGISTFEGFDVGDVVGPERLTRSRASGRYVPVKNANGESIVIFANSFPVSQRVENGGATGMKEVSGKVTGKRSASRGGRLGWSNSVDSTIHGDMKQDRASKGAEEETYQLYNSPSSAALRKKKPSERSIGKEGKSAKRTSSIRAVSKVTHHKLQDSSQLGKSGGGHDETEQEVARIESGSAVKRRTPRPRSKIRGHAVDAQPEEFGDPTPSIATGRISHHLSFDSEPMSGPRNSPQRQPGQRGPRSGTKHDSQVQGGRTQAADKDGVVSREAFSASGECLSQLPPGEDIVGKEPCFSVENSLKLQGDGSFGSSVLDEFKAAPKNPLLVLSSGNHAVTANVGSHTAQLSLSEDMRRSDELDTVLPKSMSWSELENGGREASRKSFLDTYIGASTAGNSRLLSTKIGSLEVKPLRNGEVSKQLSLMEGISRSGTTGPTCESNVGLSDETLTTGLAHAVDVGRGKSAGPDGIGSDGPAGSVLDNTEILSIVGREARALRPRRCKSDVSNGTSGANASVTVQPNSKSTSKLKKQDVGLADISKTGAGKMKVKSKGKRKRSGSGQLTATNSQICSENKSMNQDFEETINIDQIPQEEEVVMNKEGKGKRRKKGKKEPGKSKTVTSKKPKPMRRLSGQIKRSKSKLKEAEDSQRFSGGADDHGDTERGTSSGMLIVPTDVAKQGENLESHVQSPGDPSSPFVEQRKASEGNNMETGTYKQLFHSTCEVHSRDPTILCQKEPRLARMRTSVEGVEGAHALSRSSLPKDAKGAVLEDVPSGCAGHDQNTQDSSANVTGQEHPEDEPPRVGWVLCDACNKWRCIPAELADQIDATNATWTCKENPNKDYSDCATPQEKSNAEINAELQISDISGAEEDIDRDGDIDSGFQQESRSSVWTLIPHNIYLHRQRKHTTIDEMMVCNCQPPVDGSPGCDENCINRILQVECPEGHCPCGDTCSNQQFRQRSYSKVECFRCGKKGFGLRALANIAKGNFIIEYVGEVLDIDAFEIRQKEYALNGQKHFYFMTLDGNEVIDACVKGNLGRFINHSCEPNCQTEKWVVNGEVCIGLFATRDLVEGEEITFDYNYVRVGGAAAKKCECGSPGCRGFIGGDPLTPRAIVESDSDEEEDPEPIMLDGSLEASLPVSVPGRVAELSKAHSTRRARVASEPKVKGAPKVAGVKRKLSRDTEADKEGAKPRHAAAVKRVKTSKSLLPRSGLLHVKGLTIDTSHRQQRSDVEEKLNEMLDEFGGLRKKKDSAKHFLRLLVLVPVSVDSQSGLSSQRSRGLKDLSLLLDALQKTRSLVVLRDIMCKNGLMMLHNLIKHFRKDYEKLPIVRKLMKVLDWLASQKVLTPDQMYASRPGNGIESFTESLFELTRHSDKEVQNMARNFRRVYLPPSSKLSEHTAKENGWSSPPKHLQPLDQLNARGRVAAPGFHQQLPPVQDSHLAAFALDQPTKPALPGQKLAGQDWSPSGAQSGAPGGVVPGTGLSGGIAQPERALETGKMLKLSEGASKEQDGVQVNEDGVVPCKRKRKSRWDECMTPVCPAQAGEALTTGQTPYASNSIVGGQTLQPTPSPSTVLGTSTQLPSEWSKQSAQGYQRYWHQQQPPKHPSYRDHMVSAPVPGAGPPLPPGFPPTTAPLSGHFGPSVIPQSTLFCGPIAGQVVGTRGSTQGQVPPVPPMHAMGMSSFPSAAGGPHLPGMPGGQHGPWHVRTGAPVFSGPPGFQVDVSDREQFSSPWSRQQSEQREMWSHSKEQFDSKKEVDAEIEPEPPVPGLSPRDQQHTGDHLAGTHREGSRNSIVDPQKGCEIKEPTQVRDTAKVCPSSGPGSPRREKTEKELWGGKSRPLDDEQRGPLFSGQSDRERTGSGRIDTRNDRGQGSSRWEHSESTVHELARGERGRLSRSKDSVLGSGTLSPQQQSEGHGRSHHKRPLKEMDYTVTGDRCLKEGNAVAQSTVMPEHQLSVLPARGARPDDRVSEPASFQHHVGQKCNWHENKSTSNNVAQDQEHKISKDIEVQEGTSQLGRHSEGRTSEACDGTTLDLIVHNGGAVKTVCDPHGIYELADQVEEKPVMRASGYMDGTPKIDSPGPGKSQLDEPDRILRKDVNHGTSGKRVYNLGEDRSFLSSQLDDSHLEQKDNVSGSGAVTADLLPSCETSCKEVQQCHASADDAEVQICSGSKLKEYAEGLADNADLQNHRLQDVSAGNVMDEKDPNKRFECNVELDAKSNRSEATAVVYKEQCSVARNERDHAGGNGNGHRDNSVAWSQDMRHVEGKSRHIDQSDGNHRAMFNASGDGKQPDSVVRNQTEVQLNQRSSKALADSERDSHIVGSRSGYASQRTNPAEQHPFQSHDSTARPSGAEVAGRRHSFRPGVDGWESPESPGFQEHVQGLVKHFLTAYKKLNTRDMDKLNGRLGPEVIKKERKSYMTSSQTGCAKPIMKRRLDDKVRNFVDQQARLYLAMKEKDRRG